MKSEYNVVNKKVTLHPIVIDFNTINKFQTTKWFILKINIFITNHLVYL